MLESTTGIDVTTDVSDATAFGGIVPFGAIGWLTAKEPAPPPATIAAPPAPLPKGKPPTKK